LLAAQKEADFMVCFVDLGQPVPVQALETIAKEIPGTVVFTQPTPTQLLSVFQLPQWTAVLWDGSSTDVLCAQIQQRMSEADFVIRQKTFVRDATALLDHSKSALSYLEWVNPPAGRKSLLQFPLNPLLVSVTIGADQSKSQIEIPSPVKGPLLELKFIGGAWIPRPLDPSVALPESAQKLGLRIGDTIRIGDVLLAARGHDNLAQIAALVRQQGGPTDRAIEGREQINDLEDFIQNLLVGCLSGELVVTSGLRRATVYVHNGSLDQVFAGPVAGAKALERILTWPQPSLKFREGHFAMPEEPSLKIQSVDFSLFCSQVKRTWERVTALVPPMNLTLDVDPGKFSRINTLTPQQSKVLAAICEFRLVRDVLNYCSLRDLDIYDELIAFRKSGLIRITK
jgi:hypothetical protein